MFGGAGSNSAEVKIEYYLSETNFAKSASLAPCAVWMCKAGLDETKSLFKCGEETSTVSFSDACLEVT